MRPGVQVRRAVLCANGNEHLGYRSTPDEVATADRENALDAPFGQGHHCAPHVLAEQTITTSEWQKVQP